MEIPHFAIVNIHNVAYVPITVHVLTFYVATLYIPDKDGRRIFIHVVKLLPVLTLFLQKPKMVNSREDTHRTSGDQNQYK